MLAQAKSWLPPALVKCLRLLRDWRDVLACASFLAGRDMRATFVERLMIVTRLYRISYHVESPHTQREILRFIRSVLALSPISRAVIVEAGCFKGSSTAKFSLAAQAAGRQLVVFDSFQGIPVNEEAHQQNIFGGRAGFAAGDYRGTLAEVKANVSRFGDLESCRFVPGWFDETMPAFDANIAAIYLDVDLASSTRTCLKHLYPLLEPGGVLYSQDGHLPLVIDVLDDDDFWLREVGCEKPQIIGLRRRKLVKIVKPRLGTSPAVSPSPAGTAQMSGQNELWAGGTPVRHKTSRRSA